MASATVSAPLRQLSSAPTLSSFFLLTQRNLPESLISKFNGFASQGEKLACLKFGPRSTAIALHPEVVREIITKPDIFKKINREQFDNPLSDLSKVNGKRMYSLVSANDKAWVDQRKHFNPAFAMSALAKLIPMFCSEADIFVKNCEVDGADITYLTSQYALDCLGNAVLGHSFGAQTGQFKETYASYLKVMSMLADPLTSLFPSLFKLPLGRNRELRQSVAVMKALLESALETRLQQRKQGIKENPDGSKTLLDSIIDASEKDETFQMDLIVPNLWIFFIAGHDTTATSLAWIINAFAEYPEVQAKARDEIRRVIPDLTVAPSLEQLDNLDYLDAVLKENLRMNPPVYNLLGREAVADTELAGYYIPKGTGISIGIEAVNKHSDSWTDPEKFDPERFVHEEKRKNKLYSWMSFSVGPRRCIGDKFSILEQKSLICKLLTTYEIMPLATSSGHKGTSLPLSNKSAGLVFKQPAPFSVQFKRI